MVDVWRLLVGLPLLSGVALLLLLLLPDPHASVVASSQLTEPPVRHPDSATPLLWPLLAAWLLRQMPNAAAPTGAGGAADASRGGAVGGPAEADGLLSGLSGASSPRLSLCRAPACGDVDMLVVTLLQRRVRAGSGTHDQPGSAAAGGEGCGGGGSRPSELFVGVLEQWARPAAPFAATRPHLPASETLLTAALRGGDAGAVQALIQMLRRALVAPMLPSHHTEDKQPWRRRWGVEMPGPAQVSVRTHQSRTKGGDHFISRFPDQTRITPARDGLSHQGFSRLFKLLGLGVLWPAVSEFLDGLSHRTFLFWSFGSSGLGEVSALPAS
jgi:hypothetical protein